VRKRPENKRACLGNSRSAHAAIRAVPGRWTIPLLWYSTYHHLLCHNLAFGLVLVLAGWIIGARRWLTAFLVLASFHLHLAGGLIGSRSPDGYGLATADQKHLSYARKDNKK